MAFLDKKQRMQQGLKYSASLSAHYSSSERW